MTVTSIRFHPSTIYRQTPPTDLEKKKPEALLPTPIANDLKSKGVMCIDRALVETGKMSLLIPKLVRVRSQMIKGNLKNSFLEFQPVGETRTNGTIRRMSCPDVLVGKTVATVPSRPPVTTYMIRNIPTRFTSLSFVRLLEEYGFSGTFDFLYLPVCRP
jgi:hypothetical protein